LQAATADLQQARRELDAARLKLAECEKLEMIGRLAAGIAHEVKNPLTIVSLGIDYLSGSGLLDSAAASVVHKMKDGLKRAEVVIRGLLDFSAPSRLDARPQDLNCVVRQSLSLMQHEFTRGHVVVDINLADDLPLVNLDPAKMEQVFLNAFLNAVQAMPSGGTLGIRTCFRRLDEVIEVEISDTGAGISPEKLSDLFNPFFTTKPVGVGTGLGLSVSKMLVELHGGTIQIANRIEGGASLTLTFKAAAGTGDSSHEHK
jgi:signal transduction histidine kinase